MLQIHNVSYRDRLKNITTEVQPGKILVIIGPNGAGKSTLLHCIANRLPLTEGNICFDGVPLHQLKPIQQARRLALLSQKQHLAFDMLAEEVVELGLYPYQLSYKYRFSLIKEVMVQLGIDSYKGRYLSTLSGGQQQRVHLARVFAQLHLQQQTSNKLLLLDEHVSSLDPFYQHSSFRLVQQAARTWRLTVVAVVHDIALGAAYADKMLLLKDGSQYVAGSAREVITPDYIYDCFGVTMTGDVDVGMKFGLSEER